MGEGKKEFNDYARSITYEKEDMHDNRELLDADLTVLAEPIFLMR